MHMIWVKFIICAALIFIAGKHLAKYADIIAEKTGLGGVWIGLILVAVATSLPELFTGVGSVVFVDAPNLTVGNLMGANSYNLLNIGLIDLLSGGTPLLSTVSSGQLLTAVFSLIPIVLATLGIILSQNGVSVWSAGNIGIFSIAIFVSYCVITRIIYRFEKKNTEYQIPNTKYGLVNLKTAYTQYAIAALIIVISGIWLAYIGKELSVLLRLDESFVGTLFMGLATTLPEITVSIAALLIGAKEIAIANMLGSNLFNMTIIFIDDILYRKAPILSVVSPDHILQACAVMIMTAVVIIAMATKAKKKIFRVSWYVPLIFIIFILGAYFNFITRIR